jgi:hypothetical protein
MEHIYQQPQFGEDWFTYPEFYSQIVDRFSSGSKFVEVGSWKGKSSAYMAVEIANSGKDIELAIYNNTINNKLTIKYTNTIITILLNNNVLLNQRMPILLNEKKSICPSMDACIACNISSICSTTTKC